MVGEVDLAILLRSMDAVLDDTSYVFVNRPDSTDLAWVHPVALVVEDEGLTVVLPRSEADDRGWVYELVCGRITLRVQSSLAAVGLTAAVATALTGEGIAVNVIAGYHHDHLYVPSARAIEAMAVLTLLSQR